MVTITQMHSMREALKNISISDIEPKMHKELQRIGDELENSFKEMRRVRFTVERGQLMGYRSDTRYERLDSG